MPSNIPGNVAKYTGECPQKFQWIFLNITGKVAKHSGTGYVLKHCGECCQTFWGMSPNILENVAKHSGECPQKFQGISFQKIPGNLNFDLFREILLVFCQILLLNCYKTKEKTQPRSPITEQIFWRELFLHYYLELIFSA